MGRLSRKSGFIARLPTSALALSVVGSGAILANLAHKMRADWQKSLKSLPLIRIQRRQRRSPQDMRHATIENLLSHLLHSQDSMISTHLLTVAGSLEGLFQMSHADLLAVRGIGPVRAARLRAAFELYQRLRFEGQRRGRMTFASAAEIVEFVWPHFLGRRREHLLLLMLDGQHRLIRDEFVAIGSTQSLHVHPRDIFTVAVRERASALVLVHNHPGGDPQPTAADEAFTHRVQKIGAMLGILLLDHVIVGNASHYYSFAEQVH